MSNDSNRADQSRSCCVSLAHLGPSDKSPNTPSAFYRLSRPTRLDSGRLGPHFIPEFIRAGIIGRPASSQIFVSAPKTRRRILRKTHGRLTTKLLYLLWIGVAVRCFQRLQSTCRSPTSSQIVAMSRPTPTMAPLTLPSRD